jgi:hypothetical protein
MMNRKFLHASGFLAATVLALVSGVSRADSKTAPYYAMPSWDQQLAASTRFLVLPNWIDANFPLGGAAVLDRETGLVWERSPSASSFSWYAAHDHCINLNVGSRGGWRLPTVQELRSLVDPTVPAVPALPTGHPFANVQAAPYVYWSATDADAVYAWFVTFQDRVGGLSGKANQSLAWCVRGGQGVDTQ